MNIQDNGTEKMIYAEFDKYLTQVSAKNLVDNVLCRSITILSSENINEWKEISEEEADKIRQAKLQAVGEAKVNMEMFNQQMLLSSMIMNNIPLTDDQSLQVKNLYPKWETFINKELKKDYKVLYKEALYKVRQDISVVLENQPPSIDTAALYEEINESHAGTHEDPIPYNNNMELEQGKYYSQNDVVYYCHTSTGIPVYANLSELTTFVNPVE